MFENPATGMRSYDRGRAELKQRNVLKRCKSPVTSLSRHCKITWRSSYDK